MMVLLQKINEWNDSILPIETNDVMQKFIKDPLKIKIKQIQKPCHKILKKLSRVFLGF